MYTLYLNSTINHCTQKKNSSERRLPVRVSLYITKYTYFITMDLRSNVFYFNIYKEPCINCFFFTSCENFYFFKIALNYCNHY